MNDLERRVSRLEDLVSKSAATRVKRLLKLEDDTKERLKTLEVEHKMLLKSLGKYTDQLNNLRSRLALLITLHRNELGVLGADIEKWLQEK
jgi:hypothetical protein